MTASLFNVLGLAPIVGRPLSDKDEQAGAAPVALLAESLWVRGFGGDRSVVGRSIVLNGTPHQIVGVVPTAFREVGRTQIGAAGAAQIFVPLTRDSAQSRGNHTLRVVGRLRSQISLDQARDEMHRLAAGMEEEFPATNRHWGVRMERLHDSMFDPRVRVSLLVLLGAVGVVLLIACANVANLVLARATSRQRELALRAALGARPARVARQLLTESVSLAIVSGACGLAVAILSMQALRTLIPATIPRVDEIGLDRTVLGFGLFITIACGLFFGMVPATRGARANLLSARRAAGAPGSSREGGGTASWSRNPVSPRCWWSWRRYCCKACAAATRAARIRARGVMTRTDAPTISGRRRRRLHRTLLGSASAAAVRRSRSHNELHSPRVRRAVTLRDRAADIGACTDFCR